MPVKKPKIRKKSVLKRITVVGSIILPVIVFVITQFPNIKNALNFIGEIVGLKKSPEQCHILEIATFQKFPYYL